MRISDWSSDMCSSYLLLGWRYCLHLARRDTIRPNAQDFDDFVFCAVLGIILGGRIGYVAFYNTAYYLQNPFDALKIWEGGMSFHGGLIGVIVAIAIFSWRRGFAPLAMGDLVAAAAPIGLFFGRVAHSVRSEENTSELQSLMRISSAGFCL